LPKPGDSQDIGVASGGRYSVWARVQFDATTLGDPDALQSWVHVAQRKAREHAPKDAVVAFEKTQVFAPRARGELAAIEVTGVVTSEKRYDLEP
jgi:hypothetical protein